MPTLFAFLHHITAFSVVAALVVELVLLGLSAGILLVVGLLRVFYFEKGAAYYFASGAFHAKLTLFVLTALISIYPTIRFISWGKALKLGQLPQVSDNQWRWMRRVVHWELAAIAGILLSAAMMARGIGYFG